MSDGYKTKNYIKRGQSVVVGASETDTIVTDPWSVSSQDSLYTLIKLKCTTVTVAAAITAKLQHSWDGGTTWEAVGNRAQVTVTADGVFLISVISTDTSDAAQLPLWPLARLTLTTGAGDAATVTEVWVSRRV